MDMDLPTVREGRPPPDGPYEGVPAHLHQPIRHWLDGAFGCHGGQFNPRTARTAIMLHVAALCRIPLSSAARDFELYGEIMGFCHSNPDQFLDVVHTTIQLVKDHWPLDGLEEMLVYGGSVWRVTRAGLQRRVDPTAQTAFDAVTKPNDIASKELDEAWQKAYGREPSASDAWDHAIKAAEAVLIPMVVPTQAGAHMGHVLGELGNHGDKWKLFLGFNQNKPPVNPPTSSSATTNTPATPVQAFVGMLRLLYPNPDRHVGPDHREPTLNEAKAVVDIAVTIVQWCRDNRDVPILRK